MQHIYSVFNFLFAKYCLKTAVLNMAWSKLDLESVTKCLMWPVFHSLKGGPLKQMQLYLISLNPRMLFGKIGQIGQLVLGK